LILLVFHFLFFDFLFLFSLFIVYLILNLEGFVFGSVIDFDTFRQRLITLSFWIILIMALSRLNYFKSNLDLRKFFIVIIGTLFLLAICFSVSSFFLFYIIFELVVVPTFFLILGWGYSVERLQAALYIFVYTLFASLPFLLFLIYLENYSFSRNINFSYFDSKFLGYYWWVPMSLVFLVKLPIFFCSFMVTQSTCRSPFSWINNFGWGLIEIRGLWIL